MIRSALFAPGNVLKLLEKVGTVGADAVILDLEDAVPNSEKKTARKMVRDALENIVGSKRFVRVNGVNTGMIDEDLKEIVCNKLHGIYLPKVETADELHFVDNTLSKLESSKGIENGSIEICASIETAKGIMRAYPIMVESPSRVRTFGLGAGDLISDLGLRFLAGSSQSNKESLLYARSHLVFASRAAGKERPLDSVYGSIRNLEGLEQEAWTARRLGYQGKKAIHPAQVPVINRIFSPTSEELEFARKIVESFKEAEDRGSGAFMLDDTLVDIAVFKNAKELLEQFESH